MADLHPLVAQLRAERQSHGLQQKEVSEMAGTSEANLSRWETGANVPNLAGVTLWAAALGFEITLNRKAVSP